MKPIQHRLKVAAVLTIELSLNSADGQSCNQLGVNIDKVKDQLSISAFFRNDHLPEQGGQVFGAGVNFREFFKFW